MLDYNKFVAKASPKIAVEEAARFIQEEYGLEPLTLKALASYEDQNFYLKTLDGREFVFKISRAGEEFAVLEAQHRAMERLKLGGQGFLVAQAFPNIRGEEILPLVEAGKGHLARMLTFVPGMFLADVQEPSFFLWENIGRFFGRLTKTLEGFSHPGTWRYSRWDIKHALNLLPFTSLFEDPEKKRVLDYFLLQFESVVMPLLPKLRVGVIHGDGNEHNILMKNEEVAGVIDFGDLVETITIAELAIAATYAMIGQDNPFECGARVVAGFHRENTLREEEWDVLFPLIGTRLCMSVIYATLQGRCDPGNSYATSSHEPAWELLIKMAAANPLGVKDLFRKRSGLSSCLDHPESLEDLKRRRHHFLGKNLSLSYERPLKIVQGAYQYLFDSEGKTYVDGVNNVAHVGHNHPRIVRAGQKQMAVLNTNTRYLHDNILLLAEKLVKTLPRPLEVCYFVCSGSEASDLALRLSRAHTGRKGAIVVDGAYHGNTTAAIELSPYKFDGPGGKGAAPYIFKTLMPDPYRGMYKKGTQYAADIENILNQHPGQVGAFFCESILGCGGQIVPPENYLKEAFHAVRKAGGVCVSDEVQVGFGRVGSHFWGFELHGVIPDIVIMGKPMGNGHPLAAVVTTREIADSFNNGMEYFNTFGGNPVSCAIGLALLEVIAEERLQENALEVGNFLKKELQNLAKRFPLIGDVRGEGLFLGWELVKDPESLAPAPQETKQLVESLKEKGFLLSIDGPLHNIVKFKPPLVFSKKNAADLLESLEDFLRGF